MASATDSLRGMELQEDKDAIELCNAFLQNPQGYADEDLGQMVFKAQHKIKDPALKANVLAAYNQLQEDAEAIELCNAFLENPQGYADEDLGQDVLKARHKIKDPALKANVLAAYKQLRAAHIQGQALNNLLVNPQQLLQNQYVQQQTAQLLQSPQVAQLLQDPNIQQQGLQLLQQNPQIVDQIKGNQIYQNIAQHNPQIAGMVGQAEQMVNMYQAINEMARGLEGMANDIEHQFDDFQVLGDHLNDAWSQPLPDVNEPNISEEEKGNRQQAFAEIVKKRNESITKVKKYFDDDDAKDQPEQQSWFIAQLNKKIIKEIYTLDGNRQFNVRGNHFRIGYNIALSCTASGYDLAKLVFLSLQLAIEKKFFDNFRSYVTRSYCTQFDQHKESLVQAYKDALSNPSINVEQALMVAFIKNFCVKKRMVLPLFTATGMLVFMRWAADGLEKYLIPQQGPADVVTSLLQHLFTTYDQPLPAGQVPTIPVMINPAQWAIALIRERAGLSLMYDISHASRGDLLAWVGAQYPADSWYRKLLEATQKVTEHPCFDMAQRLYMWYVSINYLYDLCEYHLKHYMQMHMRDLVTCVSNVAQAQNGSQEARDADAALKAFIARGVCDKSFTALLKQKNGAYVRTGKLIEFILSVPIQIEMIKLMVKFGIPLIRRFIRRMAV